MAAGNWILFHSFRASLRTLFHSYKEPVKPTYVAKVASAGNGDVGKGVQHRFLDEEDRRTGTTGVVSPPLEEVCTESNLYGLWMIVENRRRNEIAASKKIIRNAAYMSSNPERKTKKFANGVKSAVVVPTVEGQECQDEDGSWNDMQMEIPTFDVDRVEH
ncbi:hypothetical protein V6N13_074344 [Hibiscus sabdariffa]